MSNVRDRAREYFVHNMSKVGFMRCLFMWIGWGHALGIFLSFSLSLFLSLHDHNVLRVTFFSSFSFNFVECLIMATAESLSWGEGERY